MGNRRLETRNKRGHIYKTRASNLILFMFQSDKKGQISLVIQHILGSTPNDKMSESKKLLVLLSKRFLISGVILGITIDLKAKGF